MEGSDSGDKSAEAAKAQTDRGLVTLALLLAMSVTSLEQTVVSTAMPSIIAQLHGLDIYPWVYSAYLLAATVTTPLYGKLADILGRKKVLLFGLGLFTLGSMLSGLSRSMPELIAMRVVQGLGAGAVGPIVLTLLGDLFSLEERAKVQGWFSAVWGTCSLIGPWLGGMLTDRISWRWVFFVTVPFSLAASLILIARVRETIKERKPLPIDWSGAVLLTLGSTALLSAVLQGGRGSIAYLVAAVILLVLFVRVELRAADPILPIDLFEDINTASAMAGGFLIGALLFGIDTYLPLFVQGVRGKSAEVAGQTITPLFLSWALSVAVAARVVVRMGYRRTAVGGSFFIAVGTLSLVVGATYPGISRPLFMVGLFILGLGMGPVSLCTLLGVQNSVPWGRRGAATAAAIFFRTMGGAIGVGLLGASLGLDLSSRLAGVEGVDIGAALRPETHEKLTASALLTVQTALGGSLRNVFLEIMALAAVMILCTLGLRGGRATSHEDAGSGMDEGVGELEEEGLGFAVGMEH